MDTRPRHCTRASIDLRVKGGDLQCCWEGAVYDEGHVGIPMAQGMRYKEDGLRGRRGGEGVVHGNER
eukprot:3409820-Rhodomonas_salina.2